MNLIPTEQAERAAKEYLESIQHENDGNLRHATDDFKAGISQANTLFAEKYLPVLGDAKKSNERLIALVEEIESTLFHHNHSVEGWHLNGNLEPMMNFVADFDMDAINEAKSTLSKLNELLNDK